MFSYTEAKQFLIDHLTQDVIAHEAGRYRDVGQAFDELMLICPVMIGQSSISFSSLLISGMAGLMLETITGSIILASTNLTGLC